MEWVYLMLAILFENAGTMNTKLSQGLTRPLPSLLMFVFYLLSYTCFAFALKKIDVSVAYAIWSGLGTTFIAILGFVWFHESVTIIKLMAIGLIVLGVVILNLSGGGR